MSNILGTDQADVLLGLFCVQTVCKSKQQTTLEDKDKPILCNPFLASSDFCHLLITLENVGPDLDPNGLTLCQIVFLKEFFERDVFSSPEPKAQGELSIGLEPASVRPSVRPHFQDQLADRNQILSGASLGWGLDCIRFWVRSDQNSGFHGNR